MKKICKITNKEFEITNQDLEFYKKMGVSTPTLCSEERQRRRLSWQNMYNLYHVECRATGKKVISCFSDSKKYNLFSQDYWWGDKWNFTDYGMDFDFEKDFFKQFNELLKSTPIPCLFTNYENDVNSDYTNYAGYDKNCYLIFHADENEDCLYATGLKKSKKCVDSLNVFDSELTYECTDCQSCYNLNYSQDCEKCSDSYFLTNCEGCNFCFGCTNQMNQKYMIFNEQKTKEEYLKFIQDFDSGKRHIIDLVRKKNADLIKNTVTKTFYGKNNENCSGNHLFNCKDVTESYDIKESRNMKFCERIYNGPNSDCYDVDQFGLRITRVYDSVTVGVDCNNIKFCGNSYNLINSEYVLFGFSTSDCFACVGLKNAQYCIFNKQYTKEQYFELKEKIIAKLKQDNVYGEFFPASMSPYGYTESIAQEYFPLSDTEIISKNLNSKSTKENTIYNGEKVEIQNDISDISEDILKKILTCETCSKNYRLVEAELKFYKEKNIPIPVKCSNCRHMERRGNRK